MSLAIGGSSAATPSIPAHGTQWVDVRNFGAVGDGLTDSTAAFQAAVDHLIAIGGGTVFVPSAPANYLVTKSIWVDASNIEIVGEGISSSILMSNYYKQPVFIFGIQRVQSHVVNGVTISQTVNATYRPDLFGKLDASAVSYAGTMWGYRSNGDSFVQFQAGPMSSGQGSAQSLGSADNWSETNKLTIDFCIEPPDGQQFVGTPNLFGIGTPQSDPAPFGIAMSDPNTVRVYFRTSDFNQGTLFGDYLPRYRGFDFSIAGADRPYKIAIQFDHVNAVCSAFVQIGGVRTQVPLINQVNMTNSGMFPYTPNAGLTFILNDHYPFLLGSYGIVGGYGALTGIDLRVYGLRMSNTIRYQTNGPGTRQVRTDAPGTPVNDFWAYFGSDSNTICYLRGLDNPATAGRILSVSHGGATSGGYTTGLIQHSLGVQTFFANNAIRNIWVQGSGNHGQVISLGSLFEFTAENVKATGGFHGIGSFNIQSSYTIYLRNCVLDGTDAPYYGFMQLISARDIAFASSGRVTIRTVGCGDDWYNIFIAGVSPNVECFYKARLRLRRQQVDHEHDLRLRGVHDQPRRHLLRDARLRRGNGPDPEEHFLWHGGFIDQPGAGERR